VTVAEATPAPSFWLLNVATAAAGPAAFVLSKFSSPGACLRPPNAAKAAPG
jgi:hypothetical protein